MGPGLGPRVGTVAQVVGILPVVGKSAVTGRTVGGRKTVAAGTRLVAVGTRLVAVDTRPGAADTRGRLVGKPVVRRSVVAGKLRQPARLVRVPVFGRGVGHPFPIVSLPAVGSVVGLCTWRTLLG